MKTIFALAISVALAGCAATGVQVTEAQTSAFVKGETTRSQVIQALGAPTTQTKMPDGTSMIMYTYAEASVRPSSFIPLVGAFVGGADSRGTTVMMRFDANDRLIDTTSSESNYGTGRGLSSGASFQQQPQPRK